MSRHDDNEYLRSFSHAIVRKLAYLLVALVVAGAVSWFNEAKAQDYSTCTTYSAGTTSGTCPDQGRAYMAAMKQCEWRKVNQYGNQAGWTCTVAGPLTVNGGTEGAYYGNLWNAAGGYVVNVERRYPIGQTCAKRADLGGLYQSNFQGGPKVCSYGCEYGQSTVQTDTTITDKANPSNTLRFGILFGGKANGNTCTNPDGNEKPKEKGEEPPSCLQVGSDSAGAILHCPTEDGGSCTISGRGTKFCQPKPPANEGPKADTGRNDASSPAPGTTDGPAPAPRPGESWGKTSSSTTTNNIDNSKTTNTTYSSNGTGNPNASPVPGDGSKNGTGQQAGTGTGTGTGGTTGGGTTPTDMGPTNSKLDAINGTLGEIKDKMDGGDAGDTGESEDLYEPGEDTLESLWADYQTRVGNTDMGGAVSGFFTFNAGGSCPTVTIPATKWWDTMTFNGLCSGWFANALGWAGFLVLGIAAFFAVTRVAIY